MLDEYDILWLQTAPSIAAIYYHTHLEATHVLFCPDDIKRLDDLTVRDLGRSILNVVDSNNKKVAVHFMQPCSIRKHQDVLRFLHRMRNGLMIKCLIFPTTPIQTSLLAGWAMSLGPVPDRERWIRRCLTPYNKDAFGDPEGNGELIPDYSQPFCIADNGFTKRTLIVNITLSMCTLKSGSGLVLNDGAIAAIQGWADVVKQQSLPGTIILIGNEKTFFKNVPSEPTLRDLELQRNRDSTYRFLEKLGTECPIYLYTHDYKSSTEESSIQKIASILHLHHVWLSGSYILSWSRKESGLEKNCPDFFSGLRRFYLTDILVQKSRAIWKNDFMELLQRTSNDSQEDNIIRISPSIIDSKNLGKVEALTPLLYNPDDNNLTKLNAYMGIVRHSISASNAQVFQSWKAQMQRIEPQRTISEKVQSVPVEKPPQTPPPQNLFQDEDAISELQYSYADLLDNKLIEKYIENKGAYHRGQGILSSVYDMTMSGDLTSIKLSAKAKGTSADPYDICITLSHHKSITEIEIQDGLCSCPVGKKGKCKHCTALLLRYMVNTDEFQYIPHTQQLEQMTKQSEPDESPLSSTSLSISPELKSLASTPPMSSTTLSKQPATETSKEIGLGNLSIVEGQKSSERKPSPPQPEKPKVGRILPWQLPSASEDPKSTKKRVIKKEPKEPKKPIKRKKPETDQDNMSTSQPPKAKRPRAASSRKKALKESEDEDQFEIDPKKLKAKRTVTRRKKDAVDSNDEGKNTRSKSKGKQRAADPEIWMDFSDDDDDEDDGFNSRSVTTESNRRQQGASPIISIDLSDEDDGIDSRSTTTKFEEKQRASSPTISMDFSDDNDKLDYRSSTNSKMRMDISDEKNGGLNETMKEAYPDRATMSQTFPLDSSQFDDDDSDATDDGLGVVHRKSNPASQMSTDQPSIPRTESLNDVEMPSIESKISTDQDKTLSYRYDETTEDLFDELGL